jgi:hypothetical protein
LQLSAGRPQRSHAILAIGITAALAAEAAGCYEKTCSDISVSGLTLKASCNTFSGQSMPTSLDFTHHAWTISGTSTARSPAPARTAPTR